MINESGSSLCSHSSQITQVFFCFPNFMIIYTVLNTILFSTGLLFHRVILMSGSGLAPWSLVSNPAKYAAFVSHHVNCSADLSHQQLMKCLREKPLALLLSAPVPQPDFEPAFGPSVDGVVIGKFMKILSLSSSRLNDLPILGDSGPSLAVCTSSYKFIL